MRNVLDEEYVATLGVLNAAPPDARVIYPGTPRSAYVGARVRF
jgi:outer membrane receptor protein involved in Fe transport